MLLDEIKARITRAMKEKDEVARDVLRLAFGEVQTAEANKARALADEEVAAVLRKLVKSNEETLSLGGEDEKLRHEIAVLQSLLPKSLTPEQIAEALSSQADAIRAAKSDGQAMGVAMKHLKSTGASVEANDVTAAVKKLRAG
jgi:uncharacterized protein YqeY